VTGLSHPLVAGLRGACLRLSHLLQHRLGRPNRFQPLLLAREFGGSFISLPVRGLRRLLPHHGLDTRISRFPHVRCGFMSSRRLGGAYQKPMFCPFCIILRIVFLAVS
jgi:hypothetical protein